MREGDARGRRLAIVSHELMNAHLADDSNAVEALALLEELGYGLMSLPPITQSDSIRVEALSQLVDQLQDYLRHGYTAIVVESRPADDLFERLDTVCSSRGIALPRRIRLGINFREALEAVRAVRPGSGNS
jgi:hypothetical protein